MNIIIDTPYVTTKEFARRAGISPRSVTDKINEGKILAWKTGEKDGCTVFINMIFLAKQAAEQAERVCQASVSDQAPRE